jgi:hypothetical protein
VLLFNPFILHHNHIVPLVCYFSTPPFLHVTSPHLPGCKTSHPLNPPISSMSSSIKFLALPPAMPLPLLEPVPVLGGSGGFASSSLLLSAIDRLGRGSSRYCGIVEAVLDLERRAGFLVGIGGGAGLRRTWGPVRIVGGLLGRVGRERVEAVEALRRRSSSASRLPSKFAVWAAWVGKAGTMSFLADGFCGPLWCVPDAETGG